MASLKRLIPSMFHRRLLLLVVVFCCAIGILGVRVAWLTVVRGKQLREEAEQVLSMRRLIDTERGRILDAKGRVLAEDRPSFDIAVDYNVITGQWAYGEARRLAYQDFRETWGQMSFSEREDVIEEYREPFDNRLEDLWETMARLSGVERSELERRKMTVVERVQAIRVSVWGRRARKRAEELGSPVELSEVAIPIAEEREAHTLLPAVTDDVAYEFRKRIDELPGLEVIRSKERQYPYKTVEVVLDRSTLPSPLRSEEPMRIAVNSVGGHFIGGMGEVWPENLDPNADPPGRPFHRRDQPPDLGGYLPGDRIGRGGVEGAEEARLRGVRGQRVRRRDTGEISRQPHQPGDDVHLTIDMMLQARIRALMDPAFGVMEVQPWHETEGVPIGTPLHGAAVVMEVDSGNILAMVSTPMPPPREPGEPYPDLRTDPNRPLVNKPLSAIYPPGSTLKPIVYCIAAAQNEIGWDEAIDCQGHLLPDRPDIYRCWGWRPDEGRRYKHGPLDPIGAIARSCNIYFYDCGRRLGAERLVAELHRWGFDQPTEIGLPAAVTGIMPYLDAPNPPGRELSRSNAIILGIGQGPIAVPPLQVAAAHAALARGGYYLSPVLIRERAGDQTDHDLALPPPVIAKALQGMDDSANNSQYGTANYIVVDGEKESNLNADGVIVRAKTGTAQAPNQYQLVIEDGKPVLNRDLLLRSGSHSWYVAHVQEPGSDRASYIVVVMVEYGGSGGRVSGPVANQIIHALGAEGYLNIAPPTPDS